MHFRTLPRTGVRFSEVTFGAGTAGGLMIGATPEEQRAAVRRALDLGINHFDTSPIYGMGCSEVNLGNALAGIGDEAVVTTKVAIEPENVLVHSIGQRIRRSVAASLQRLRRDHIDVLLVHNGVHFKRSEPLIAEHPAPWQPMMDLPHLTLEDILGAGGAWEAVKDLMDQGVVRAFGLSGQDNDANVLRAAMGSGVIDVFNQPLNLLNPSPAIGTKGYEFLDDREENFVDYDSVCAFAAQTGVGVSVITPVAAGVLTTAAQSGHAPPSVSDWKPRFPYEGHYERELARAAAFLPVAEQAGITITELAWRYPLSVPGVFTILGGFSDLGQMEEGAKAVEAGPLPADVLTELERVWIGPSPVAATPTSLTVGAEV